MAARCAALLRFRPGVPRRANRENAMEPDLDYQAPILGVRAGFRDS